MKRKHFLPFAIAAVLMLVIILAYYTPVQAATRVVYSKPFSESYDLAKNGYIPCAENDKDAMLYRTTYEDYVTDWQEVDEATYDKYSDEFRKFELVGTKKTATHSYDLDTILESFKSTGARAEDANRLGTPNYIASGTINLTCHNRGTAICNNVTGNTPDYGIVGISDEDLKSFNAYWSGIAMSLDAKPYNPNLAWTYQCAGSDANLETKDITQCIYYSDSKTTIEWNGMYGVLIAPNATVVIRSCNWAGIVVAKNIDSAGEGHMVARAAFGDSDLLGKYSEPIYKYYVKDTGVNEIKEYVKVKPGTPDTGDGTPFVIFIAALGLGSFILACVVDRMKKLK